MPLKLRSYAVGLSRRYGNLPYSVYCLFFILSISILPLLLGGCISERQSTCISITDTVRYCLVPDAASLQSGIEMVHVKGMGIDERVIFQFESKDTTLSVGAVSPIGHSVFSLEWNGEVLSSQSVFGEIVTRHSKRLLMLLQWLKWPEDQVLQGFRGGFVHWHHEQKGLMHLRRLSVEDRLLLQEEKKENGERIVTFPAFGVRIMIQNIDG